MSNVASQAAALEPQLKGGLFLGGGTAPSAADVKAFNALLGVDHANLHRWVKHMTSYTATERAAWPATAESLPVAAPQKEGPKPAQAPPASTHTLAPVAAPAGGTSSPVAHASTKAAVLEPKLRKGTMFLGGDVPSAEDIEAFDDLLGANNVHLFRWVRHMNACGETERASWPAKAPASAAVTTTAVSVADASNKAAELEPKLAKGKFFLGGDVPSAVDVKAFDAMIGAGNVHLARWVKHMASFTSRERGAWRQAAPESKKTTAAAAGVAPVPAPKAEAKEDKPKLAAATAPKAGTSVAVKDVSKGAAALEPKLAGSRYLGGDKPSAADVKAFDELLGAGNVHLFRWLKSVAAVPAKERAKWKAAPKAKAAPAKAKTKEVAPVKPEEAAPAKHRDPAVLQSRVQLDLAPWSADVDLAALAEDIRGCEAPPGMVWEPAHQVSADGHLVMAAVVEDERVCADDVEELVMQFESLIKLFKIAAWQKL